MLNGKSTTIVNQTENTEVIKIEIHFHVVLAYCHKFLWQQAKLCAVKKTFFLGGHKSVHATLTEEYLLFS